MPLIEELPLTNPRAAQPGWAYVADVNSLSQIPSQQQQPGKRKRAAVTRLVDTLNASGTVSDAGTLSRFPAQQITSKQQKAIDQRLKDLGRENYRDGVAVVGVPKAEGGVGIAGGQGKKMSTNVKRILGYSRNFGHYLADEEAAIAAGGGGFQGTWGSGLSVSANAAAQVGGGKGGAGDKRKAGGGGGAAGKTKKGVKAEVVEDAAGDVAMSGTDGGAGQTPGSATAASGSSATVQQQSKPRYDPALDKDPLLRTLNVLPKPSERVIAALLAEPPLSYTAARAAPLPADKQKPRRWFCVICGYWGKVKCRRCGERCCGLLECWRGHEAGGCVPY